MFQSGGVTLRLHLGEKELQYVPKHPSVPPVQGLSLSLSLPGMRTPSPRCSALVTVEGTQDEHDKT